MPSLAIGLLDGVSPAALQRRVRSCDHAVGTDLDEPAKSQLLGLGLVITTTAAAPSEILRGRACGDGAVLRKAGLSPPRDSAVVLARTLVLGGNSDRVTLALRIFTGTPPRVDAGPSNAAAARWCDSARTRPASKPGELVDVVALGSVSVPIG